MKRTLVCLLLLLFCATVALAEPALDARLENGRLALRWTGCDWSGSDADRLPRRLAGAGKFPCAASTAASMSPSGTRRKRGDYAAQLRCSDGCVRVEAGSVGATPTRRSAGTDCRRNAPSRDRRADAGADANADRSSYREANAAADAGLRQQHRLPRGGRSFGRQTWNAHCGLSALRVDAELNRAATGRARELVQSFSHTRPDGSDWSSVSSAVSGENIAKGHDSVDRVMAAWMSSDGHRANILRAGFGRIGVCAWEANGVLYWVQLFGV